MWRIWWTVIILVVGRPGLAQEVVTVEHLCNIPAQELRNKYGDFIRFSVRTYKLEYTTPAISGSLDTASGLLVVPDTTGFAWPLIIYNHGTINFRDSIPSELCVEAQIPIVYAGVGGVAFAPDYLGHGSSKGFHPYLHRQSEALTAINMTRSVRTLGIDLNFVLNDHFFITGYSQGGHVAASMHQMIEEFFPDEFAISASAFMSGPYDLSGTMKRQLLSDAEYFFPAFLINVLASYNLVYQLYPDFSYLLRSPYDSLAQLFFQDEIEHGPMNEELIDLLTAEFGGSIPKLMMQDSILEAVRTVHDHPLNQALMENDVYHWKPLAPVRLYYCSGDDRVNFMNSTVADSAMKHLGAADVEAIDLSPVFDHEQCVPPVILASLFYFSTYDPVTGQVHTTSWIPLRIFPNPTTGHLTLENAPASPSRFYLFSSGGRIVMETQVVGRADLDLTSLPPGTYFGLLKGKDALWSGKITLSY